MIKIFLIVVVKIFLVCCFDWFRVFLIKFDGFFIIIVDS